MRGLYQHSVRSFFQFVRPFRTAPQHFPSLLPLPVSIQAMQNNVRRERMSLAVCDDEDAPLLPKPVGGASTLLLLFILQRPDLAVLPPPHEVGMHYIQELAVGARFGASVGGCVGHHRPTRRSTWGTHFVPLCAGHETEDGEKPTHRGRGATLGLGATSGFSRATRAGGRGVETHSIGSARESALRSSRFPKEVLKTGRASQRELVEVQPTRAAALLARVSCAGVYASPTRLERAVSRSREFFSRY